MIPFGVREDLGIRRDAVEISLAFHMDMGTKACIVEIASLHRVSNASRDFHSSILSFILMHGKSRRTIVAPILS